MLTLSPEVTRVPVEKELSFFLLIYDPDDKRFRLGQPQGVTEKAKKLVCLPRCLPRCPDGLGQEV